MSLRKGFEEQIDEVKDKITNKFLSSLEGLVRMKLQKKTKYQDARDFSDALLAKAMSFLVKAGLTQEEICHVYLVLHAKTRFLIKMLLAVKYDEKEIVSFLESLRNEET